MNLTLLGITLSLSLGATTTAPDDSPPRGAPGVVARAGGQIFADFDHVESGASRFNTFRLSRAELHGAVEWSIAKLFLNLEAVRAGGPQSLYGIDGDSLVMRLKHGYGAARPQLGTVRLDVRAGLIPDPFVEHVERDYPYRGLSAIAAESFGLFDTSDLGASLGASILQNRVQLSLAFMNGEGRNMRELNPGKNAQLVARVEPLRFTLIDEQARLAITAVARDGSLGPASARNHRFGGALALHHPRFNTGVEVVRGVGFEGRGTRDVQAWGVWAGGTFPWRWLGAFGRYDVFDHMVGIEDTDTSRLQFALLVEPLHALAGTPSGTGAPLLRAAIGWSQSRSDAGAAPTPGIGGVTSHTFFITLNVVADAAFGVSPAESP